MPVSNTIDILVRVNGGEQAEASLDGVSESTRGLGTDTEETTDKQRSFRDGLAQSGRSLTDFGQTILPISLAVAGLGVAATVVGADYDREFTKIETLVGVAGSEVDRMRESTLRLAGATAQAPQELASAMFTIQSAGLRGAEGAEALEISAQLAAIGMGTSRDVAQALTGVLNAYAASNIDAAEAGDFLTATARAGNFEVSQLAGALGRVLPTASAAGLELSEVGGAIAILTRNGLSASEAVTQTNAVIRGMVAPSQEAQTAVSDAGSSFDEVRGILQDQGLNAALLFLNEIAGGSQEQFVRLVGGSEAAGAAFTILNADAATLDSTFGAVANAAGLTQDAFETLQNSDAFKLDQAINEIKVAFVDFGTSVLPATASGLDVVGEAASVASGAFNSLDEPTQQAIVGIGGFIAIAGPAAIGAGKLATGLASIGAGAGVVGIALAGAALLFTDYVRGQQQAAETTRLLTEALVEQEGSVPALVNETNRLIEEYRSITAAGGGAAATMLDLSEETDSFRQILLDTGGDGGSDLFDQLGRSIEEFLPALRSGTGDFGEFNQIIGQARILGLSGSEAFQFIAASIEDANLENGEFLIGLAQQSIAVNGSLGALNNLAGSLDVMSTGYSNLTEEQRQAALDALRSSDAFNLLGVEQRQAAIDAINSAASYGELQTELENINSDLSESIEVFRLAAVSNEQFARIQQQNAAAAREAGDATRLQTEEIEAAVAAAGPYSDSIQEARDANFGLSEQLDAVAGHLADVDRLLNALNGDQQSYDAAVLNTIESFERLGAAAGFYGDGLDAIVGTELGRDFVRLSRDTATAIQDEVLAFVAKGGSLEDATALQDGYIDSLRATLDQAGLTEDEIDNLIETYALVPESVLTELVARIETAKANVDEITEAMVEYGALTPEALLDADSTRAREALAGVIEAVTGYDESEYAAALDADSDDFDATFAAVVLQLAGLDAEQVSAVLAGDATSINAAIELALEGLGLIDGYTASATIAVGARANIGTISFNTPFAAGGFSPDRANQHMPHIATMQRTFAEPETGGEAYIPLANDWRRGRALAIWRETGRRLGAGGGQSFAAGGLLGAQHVRGNTMHLPVGGIVQPGLFTFDGLTVNVPLTINMDGAGGGGAGTVNLTVNVNAASQSDQALARTIAREVDSILCEAIGEARVSTTSTLRSTRII